MEQTRSEPKRVLLFGKDASLLDTRARVLQSAGILAETTSDIDMLRDLSLRCDGIVCCYSTLDAEFVKIMLTTRQNQIALLKLTRLVTPQDLILQVTNMFKSRPPEQ